jgi:cytochrome bd-type quinol oxidase subunit 2
MQNRVQRALARRERMRRSRDQAWMVFAGFAVAAIFGWILLVSEFTSELRMQWWATLIYGLIAVVSTLLAYRAFGASKRLTRRLDEAQPLETDDGEARQRSVWDEIWGRRG